LTSTPRCNRDPYNFVPEGLHELNYAEKLLEDIGWPAVYGNKVLVAAAIETAEKSLKVTPVKAYEALLSYIKADRDKGVKIDAFYFKESKWRNKPKEKPKRELTAGEKFKLQLEELNA
jgi:hypothetical protein